MKPAAPTTGIAERVFEAERNVSYVRGAVVAFNVLAYVTVIDRSVGIPWLAWATILVAFAYAALVLLARPYRKYPVLLTSYFTTATDAALITAWVAATGGLASPFFVLWYLSLAAVAFRYDARATVAASVVYAILYAGLIAGLHQLAGSGPQLLVREAYILLTGALGALIAAQGTREALARTELRARVAEARSAETRFRGLLESAPDAIVIVDRAERITLANRQTEILFGYRREEMLGLGIGSLLPDLFRGSHEVVHEDALHPGIHTHGSGLGIESAARRRDGSDFPAEISLSPIETDEGVLITILIRDVTERKRQEARLVESEERLRGVVENTPDILLNIDAEGKILFINRAVPPFRVDQVIGSSVYDFSAPAERARLKEIHERVFATGQPETYESQVLGSNGRVLWYRSSAGPVRREGKLVALVINTTDVTESKRGEDALRESEARFRALSDAAFEGIVIHERGKILETNAVFARLFGYDTPADVVGKPLAELLAPEDRERFERLVSARMIDPLEVTGVRRDGSRVTLDVVARTMPYHGSPVSVSAIRDASERKRAEEERLKSLAQLKELDRLKEVDEFKTQFINTAAHELNTPLTPIKLQVHLLKTSSPVSLDDRQRRAIDVLDRNVDRLGQLVRDVLDVARLQASRLGIVKRSTDLNRLVLETVESFQESARLARVTLLADLAPDLRVEADPQRLTQVLFNLLSNALKFTPAEGRIVVETRRERGAATVRVRDSGAGLTKEQIERLFKPFSQVHDTMQTTRAGTGLGLYISKGILELHGGTIGCESPGPGKGSTFTFVLPIEEAPPAALPPKPREPEKPAKVAKKPEEKKEDAIAKRARELI